MPERLLTTDDLYRFKLELLEEIKKLLNVPSGAPKRYLKSTEVQTLLEISPGTLQNLRINGTLPYSKIGGIIYYDADDIQKVMDANRVQHVLKL